MSTINAFSRKETCHVSIKLESLGSLMMKLSKKQSTPIPQKHGKCAILMSKTNGSETPMVPSKSTKKSSDNSMTSKSYIFILIQWIVSGTMSGAVPITGTKKWF